MEHDKNIRLPSHRAGYTQKQWQQVLSPEAFYVCRQQGTEQPFTGQYNQHFLPGTYTCHCCGQALFSSHNKFDASCGWPSFDAPIKSSAIQNRTDTSHGMVRKEVICQSCQAHLGHVFPNGPTATESRYCINSAALNFHPTGSSS